LVSNVFIGLDGFAEEAEGQARYIDTRSPVYARLMRVAIALLADDGTGDDATRKLVLGVWGAREFHARYERLLLLCASIRFEALRDPAHPLARAIALEPPSEEAITKDAVRAAIARPATLESMRKRFVQTNEVSRAIAWRLPLTCVAPAIVSHEARHAPRPIALIDLGCSAALNLVADALDLAWTDEAGAPIALASPPIALRLGLDRAPVDPRDRDAADWLRASLWPGQTLRRSRLDAALARASEAMNGGELVVEAMDALAMPSRLTALAAAHPESFLLAYQTVVADYLSPDVRAAYIDAMRRFLLAHRGRALWAELERRPSSREDAPPSTHPAEVRVHFAAKNGAHDCPADLAIRTLVLAAGEFHPSALALDHDALRELTGAFALAPTA
jgi:hypothetical protein